MSESNGQYITSVTVEDVKAAAEDLLARASGPDVADSELFPHGINKVHVRVKAGAIEVEVEISGPDHSHYEEDDEEDWLEEEMNGSFDGED